MYFTMTSMRPCEIQGEIVLDYDPKYRFGVHTDVEGNKWHVNGYANGCMLAQPLETTSRYYNSTETNVYGRFSDSWKPYKIVIKRSNHE